MKCKSFETLEMRGEKEVFDFCLLNGIFGAFGGILGEIFNLRRV